MLDRCELLESKQAELEEVQCQMQILEENEAHYTNSFSTWIFAFIVCVEVWGVVSLSYQRDYQKEHEKLMNAIGTAAIPVVLTVGCCFAIAQKFGIKQEQERLHEKYRSLLDREDD